MSMIISRRPETGQWQYRWASGLQQIFDISLAVLYRGDELIHVAPNKGEYPVDVDSIKSAKKNRDYYLSLGIPYEPLPTLAD